MNAGQTLHLPVQFKNDQISEKSTNSRSALNLHRSAVVFAGKRLQIVILKKKNKKKVQCSGSAGIDLLFYAFFLFSMFYCKGTTFPTLKLCQNKTNFVQTLLPYVSQGIEVADATASENDPASTTSGESLVCKHSGYG